MRRELIAAMVTALLGTSPALAQVGGIGNLTSGIGATSPLGGASGSPIPPLGIPLGATELSSPGLSPVPSAASGSGSTCSATSGTSSIYDGGGVTVGSGAGSTPTSGSCGAAANSSAPPPPMQLSASPSGVARSGIPLGSFELGSAGVSPMVVIPAPPVQSTIGNGTPCSTPESLIASNSC
jgi:hypothetical protein